MKSIDYYEICRSKLKYLNYADNTAKVYLHYIAQFLEASTKMPSRLESADFQSYLDQYTFTSVSQQNQVINAIRFLYKYGLEKKYGKVSFKRPRAQHKLPQPIATAFLLAQIAQIHNLKHKAILSLAYSTGMRVSEVCNLKIVDIDSARMMIHIRSSKGNKDRYVPLSQNILTLLRRYFVAYSPVIYLFNGQKNAMYSATSCGKLVKKYIGKQYHFHQLRHSTTTSLLEAGTDIAVIQKLLGHSKIDTTMVYAKVSNTMMSRLSLPI